MLRNRIADAVDDLRASVAGASGRRRGLSLARGPFAAVALVALCLAVYLPGLWSIPAIDRDEARFAQASRQMFESVALPPEQRSPVLHRGGVVVPYVGAEPRLNKPPLIYWLQSASAAIATGGDPARDAIWMYRVPSVLSAIVAVVLTWRIGRLLFDPRAAWLGAAFLAVCPVVVLDAHQARADQLLLACTTGAMLGLAAVWKHSETLRPTRMAAVGLCIAVGLGVLAKGPVTPMIVITTALAASIVTRRWRWLGRLMPVTGVLIVSAMLAAWLVPLAAQVGWSEYLSIVMDETLGRAAAGREGHGAPPGYHTVLLPVLFWPGSMLTALALVRAWGRARGPAMAKGILGRIFRRWSGRGGEVFCLAWVVPGWIIFEAVSTKLPHYVLPLYPAIALLSARGVLAAAAGTLHGVASIGTRIGLGLWLAIGVALAVAAPAAVLVMTGSGLAWLTAPPMIAGAVWTLWRARASLDAARPLAAQRWSIAAAVLGLGAFTGVTLPAAALLWNTREVERLIAAASLPPATPVAAAGYHEDSLVFATRGTIERIDNPLRWATENRRGVLILPASETPTLVASDRAPPFERLGTVPGFNYSTGKPVRLDVLRLSPQPAPEAAPPP